MKSVPLLLSALLATACASYGPTHREISSADILTAEKITKLSDRAIRANMAREAKEAAKPPPPTWRAGARWDFVLYEGRSKPQHRISFQLTDEPSSTCVDGGWKKLRVLDDPGEIARSPAYFRHGRNVIILLGTGICDAHHTIHGKLRERSFLGKHTGGGMFVSDLYGRATGKPVAPVE